MKHLSCIINEWKYRNQNNVNRKLTLNEFRDELTNVGLNNTKWCYNTITIFDKDQQLDKYRPKIEILFNKKCWYPIKYGEKRVNELYLSNKHIPYYFLDIDDMTYINDMYDFEKDDREFQLDDNEFCIFNTYNINVLRDIFNKIKEEYK